MSAHASPKKLGWAVGVGVFLGLSPIYGFQVLVLAFLVPILRLNVAAAFLGLQVSAPPLTPFVVFAAVQTGAMLRKGAWLSLDWASLQSLSLAGVAKEFGLDFVVGSLVLAALLAPGLGLLTYAVAKARENRPPLSPERQWVEAAREAALVLPKNFLHFARWKLKLDPVFAEAPRHIPAGARVVDLGCGMGLLPQVLAQRGQPFTYFGIDWDEPKVAMAKTWLGGQAGVDFVQGDARTAPLPTADAVCIFDMLHYFPVGEQKALVDRALSALAPSGVLLIRELDERQGGMARFLEAWAVRLKWNRGAGVVPWPIEGLESYLRERGCEVATQAMGQGLFSANAFLVSRRR